MLAYVIQTCVHSVIPHSLILLFTVDRVWFKTAITYASHGTLSSKYLICGQSTRPLTFRQRNTNHNAKT